MVAAGIRIKWIEKEVRNGCEIIVQVFREYLGYTITTETWQTFDSPVIVKLIIDFVNSFTASCSESYCTPFWFKE